MSGLHFTISLII